MKKIYLSFFFLMTGAAVLAQETTIPVLDESNRIILHFTDTSGKFMQLARIFIDRGYDIEMKDPELGILRTKPGPLRGGASFTDQVEIKTIFRDSTITLSGVTYYQATGHDWAIYDIKREVSYSKKKYSNVRLSWEEMEKITELLKPAFITYSTVDVTEKAKKAQKIEGLWQYKRNN